MATNYDVLDPPFTTKLAMENYEFATSCMPHESNLHCVETAKRQNPLSELYVRHGAVPSTADARLYDLGYFQLSTVGMQQAGVVIGELWVTYEIEFYKPKLTNSVNENISIDHYAGLINTASGTVNCQTCPFSTVENVANTITPRTGSNLGTKLTGTSLTLSRPGVYLITWNGNYAANNLTTDPSAPSLGAGLLLKALLNGSAVAIANSGRVYSRSTFGFTQIMTIICADDTVVGPLTTITFAGPTGSSNSQNFSFDLMVMPIPSILAARPTVTLESLQEEMIAIRRSMNLCELSPPSPFEVEEEKFVELRSLSDSTILSAVRSRLLHSS
jgi:hypothetical protein